MTQPCFTYEAVPWPEDLAAALRIWTAGREFAWLDSCAAHGDSRSADDAIEGRAPAWSMVARQPCAILSQNEAGPARLHVSGRIVDEDASGWRLWERATGAFGPKHNPSAGAAPIAPEVADA